MRPSASSKTRRARTLPASRSASAWVSSRATPSSTSKPGPIAATGAPSAETEARATRWTSALTVLAGGPSQLPAGALARLEALAIGPIVAPLGAQIGRDRQVATRAIGATGLGQG